MKSSNGSVFRKKVGGVKAPIPFRDRSNLYDGGKMKRVSKQKQGSSVLQTYLNVVPEQKALVDSAMDSGDQKKSKDSGWLSNLNVYIDPTSATSFLNQPASSGSSSGASARKSCGNDAKKCSGSGEEIKWTSRDDPGLWREFLIVLFMICITICFCFGGMSWVLRHNAPPPPAA
jgi:hypothetical protein